MRLLRTNSSKKSFEKCLANFKQRLEASGYPKQDIEMSLSEVNFDLRQSTLRQKQKGKERLLPFVTTYHRSVQDLKKTLMANWSLIENQLLLKTIFKRPLIISYKRGNHLKDMLVRARCNLKAVDNETQPQKPHWKCSLLHPLSSGFLLSFVGRVWKFFWNYTMQPISFCQNYSLFSMWSE